MDILGYWQAVLKQDADSMREFFHDNAVINWHNTNECFNVEEFLRANCEYPGQWDGTIERIETKEDLIITVAHVFSTDKKLCFHVTSFMKIKEDKIALIDEYWGDDGIAPKWRLDKNIGRPIVQQ